MPLPPADLASIRLPISRLKTGTTLFRSHAPDEAPLWFGPGPGRGPEYRFDAPAGEYGVCYAGRSEMAAFVETFFRDLPVRVLSRANLERRAISTLVLTRPVRLVRMYGPGLARLGATSAVTGAKLGASAAGFRGQSYEQSQAWSLALHEHHTKPDGIQYPSSHDDDLLCVALFDRAHGGVRVTTIGAPLGERKDLLSRAIKRYGIKLL